MRATFILGLLLLQLPRAAQANPYAEGLAARGLKDWAACMTLLASSAEPPVWGSMRAARLQGAAGCAAQAGKVDEAFRLLGLATEGGHLQTGRIATDPHLAPLRSDPRWAPTLAASRRSEAALLKTIGDPALRIELLDLRDEDQALRRRIFAGRVGPAEFAELTAQSARHVTRLKQVLADGRFPGFALVGKEGEEAAFVLAQHADEDRPFQKRYLELAAAAVKAGDANRESVAFLTDRVAVAEGRKQVYGSQFDDKCEPYPIEAPEQVDERRQAMGLVPLAEYRKDLCSDP
jgi:hypothetical protein